MFPIEDLHEIIKKGNRLEYKKFGITVGLVFLIISVVLFYFNKSGYIYTGGVSVILLAAGYFSPMYLKHLYNIWMSFAVVLSALMTRLILIILYYLILMPIGLVIRLFNRDPLNERASDNLNTYWIYRDSEENKDDSLERQF